MEHLSVVATQLSVNQCAKWRSQNTAYAERLLNDLKDLWLRACESIKDMQRNWIGKSTVNVTKVKGTDKEFTVFTTRPDTPLLWPSLFWLLSTLVDAITSPECVEAVVTTNTKLALKSDLARMKLAKEKTGVWRCLRQSCQWERNPNLIATCSLLLRNRCSHGCTPAHDERDWEFANSLASNR